MQIPGLKRKLDDGDTPTQLYSNKARKKPSTEASLDPVYGQRSALPGLDPGTLEDGDGEETNPEGGISPLMYLRAVRKEAEGIPTILVAPKVTSANEDRSLYENGVGDFRVHYSDGAYYALSDSQSEFTESETAGRDPQLAYFDSILARYETLRRQLQQIPPQESVKALDSDHPVQMETLNMVHSRRWRWLMRNTNPLPVQLASMDKETVLRLLKLLYAAGSFLKRGAAVEMGVSRWVWALLARLPESGLMNSEEIAAVRELGKKAVLIGVGLRNQTSWEEGMNELEAGYGDDDYDDHVEKREPVTNPNEIQLDLEELEGSQAVEDRATQIKDSTSEISISPHVPDPPGISIKTHASQTMGSEVVTSLDRSVNSEGDNPTLLPHTESTKQCDFEAARSRLMAKISSENAASDSALPEAEIQTPNCPSAEQTALDAAEQEVEERKLNTKATVDMIITVAGERYGQRDLLEFRSDWGEVS